ncbi:natural resistance-associated macrophage protein-domain-containing protein [Pisolithus albus]|nr:natural resistance-associated macrophage protein-domain-containing protein [Pisolithus albus]
MSVPVVPENKPEPKQVSTWKGAHWSSIVYKVAWRVYHHARTHTGVGIVCSVAYFDPGNWGVDLQAGSQFGYSLLFCVLPAGLLAALLQVLAGRLGVVTGLDFSSHCRLLLHDRPRHRMLWRWGVLYLLYVLSEIAIISTDLAEMVGSAIALVLLFPSLPLCAGVLLTASDVMLLLVFDNPLRTRPVKMFEYLITALVLAVQQKFALSRAPRALQNLCVAPRAPLNESPAHGLTCQGLHLIGQLPCCHHINSSVVQYLGGCSVVYMNYLITCR